MNSRFLTGALLSFLFVFFINLAQASLGDRLRVFQYYLTTCVRSNCSNPKQIDEFKSRQPFYLKWFGWDCLSECKNQAQWQTIEQMRLQNYSNIPQFYGKWTFYRFFGIEEPASFLFSICNLLTNLYGWNSYRPIGKQTHDPYYKFWLIQAFIALNAWFWSMVFHARELPITEKLDYFSAYLIVIYSLYTIVVKFLPEVFYFEKQFLTMIYLSVSIPFLAFYLYHINYLCSVRFDYGYNMKVNVFTGVLSTIGWLVWCFVNRHQRPHIRKCWLSLLFLNLCLAFELFDFAPILFIIDAHSIWHLSTAFFPLFWYDFLKDEANYLVNNQDDDKRKLI